MRCVVTMLLVQCVWLTYLTSLRMPLIGRTTAWAKRQVSNAPLVVSKALCQGVLASPPPRVPFKTRARPHGRQVANAFQVGSLLPAKAALCRAWSCIVTVKSFFASPKFIKLGQVDHFPQLTMPLVCGQNIVRGVYILSQQHHPSTKPPCPHLCNRSFTACSALTLPATPANAKAWGFGCPTAAGNGISACTFSCQNVVPSDMCMAACLPDSKPSTQPASAGVPRSICGSTGSFGPTAGACVPSKYKSCV